MASRRINNRKAAPSIIDGKQFLDMLSTISLEEILNLEYRCFQHEKWRNMIILHDQIKKRYHCNVCNVVQFGDKNLFSHLSGKRHNINMDSVKQLIFRNNKSGAGSQSNGSGNEKTVPDKSPTPAQSAKIPVAKKFDPKNVAASANIQINTKSVQVKNKTGLTSANDSTANTPSVNDSQQITSGKDTTTNNPTVKELQQSNSGKASTTNKAEVKESQNSNPGKAPTASKPESKESPQATSGKAPTVNKPEEKRQQQAGTSGKALTVDKPEEKKQQQPATSGKAPSVNKPEEKKPQQSTSAKTSTLNKPEEKNTQVSTSGTASAVNKSKAKQLPSKNETDLKNNTAKPSVANPADKEKSSSKGERNVNSETESNKSQPRSSDNERKLHASLSTEEKNGETLPNLVKNPLSSAKPTKSAISCVPISKLLIVKSDVSEKTDEIEVITLDDTDTDPNNESCSSKVITKNDRSLRSNRNEPKQRNEENRRIPAVSCVGNQNESKDTKVAIFETKPNPLEITGLVGVEYVIKFFQSLSSRSPKYLCGLCDITTDQAAMQNHLVGYNHLLKYCEKHFPSAMAQYRQYMPNVPEHNVCKVLMPILKKLATAIEKHHGRGSPLSCYESNFFWIKDTIVAKVVNRKHPSEKVGPSFVHVVDANEVAMLIENANNKNTVEQPYAGYPINTEQAYFNSNHPTPFCYNNNTMRSNYVHYPKENSMDAVVDDETHKRMVDHFLRGNKQSMPQEHKHQSRTSKRPRSRSNSLDRKKRRSLGSQWNVERRSLSPLREGDIWQAYRHMVDQKVRELNVFFDLYKGDPEQHPQYQEEWQKFWKRRKDELIASGINHRTYNYQNEWILFFNARIEELYNQDVENIKIKCRERLCLPMTNDDLPDPKYHVHTLQTAPMVVEHIEEAPVEVEPEEVNVIHVLRLLTAMEDNLGSLGPLITEMLGKALQLQKIHPDKLNSMMLNTENCAILETAKEKFTGLVISKILDANKERAVKKAINETNLLLKSVPRMIRKSPNIDVNLSRTTKTPDNTVRKQSANISNKPDIPNSILKSNQIESSLGKTELAAKLASSLISQGRTSINREQLQQILQVYSMIEKKKRLENDANTSEIDINEPRRSDSPDKRSPPVLNYSERLHEDSRNSPKSSVRNYQGLTNRPMYNSNNKTAPEPSFYNNSNMMMNNGNNFPTRGSASTMMDSMNNFQGRGNATSMMNNVNNFQSSGNYMSANVARMNNTNYNNRNIMSNYNNNQQAAGTRSNYFDKTDGGEFSMNTQNSMRRDMNAPPFRNSNEYNFGGKRIP